MSENENNITKEDLKFFTRIANSQIKTAKMKESLAREKQQKHGTNFGNFNLTAPMPIMPEWGRQDRVQEPKSLKQKNRYWRLYYSRDPVISTVIDLFAEMIASDFSISGEGIDGEIKDTYEYMIEKTGLKSKLAYFVREYLAIGEVFPHLVFDEELGIWVDLIFHNPDNVEVKESPLWGVEPEVYLKLDADVKKFFTSGDPAVRELIKSLPKEFTKALNTNKGIKLDTNVNVSYIARKNHPYAGERGKSVIERLFSILTYEDAVVRSCHLEGTPVVSGSYLPIPIENIKVGDTVIDKDGRKQIVEDAWAETPDEGSLVEITTIGGYVFKCTDTHKFPVFAFPRKCQCGCGEDVGNRRSFVPRHVKRRGWSTLYDCCTNCGTTSVKHGAKGICKNCYAQYKRGKLELTLETQPVGSEWVSYGTDKKAGHSKRRLPSDYNPYQDIVAGDIKKFDFLMIPRKFEEIPSNISLAQARLLGYYVAEGSKVKLNSRSIETQAKNGKIVTPKIGIQWAMHIDEKTTWVKDIKNICASLEVDTKQYDYLYRNSISINFGKHEYSDFAEWFLEHGGEYSKTKKLSESVMGWSLDLKKEFIKGCFRGDGCCSKLEHKQDMVGYTSASYDLISQIRIILNQLGIFTSYSVCHNNGKSNGTLHKLTSTGIFARQLMEMVWGVKSSKSENRDSGAWIDDNYVYVPIKKIERISSDKKVYNLTVSGTHSYLVDGVGTYNSLSTAMRHASPLKIAKIGSKEMNWVPDKAYEAKLLELLSVAEIDPQSFLVLPWFVEFEAFGTTERAMSIKHEYDIIERTKLTALGVSQGFLHGQAKYSNLQGNMETLFMRMRNLRSLLEDGWMIPKFFRPIAEMNGFIKHSKTEEIENLKKSNIKTGKITKIGKAQREANQRKILANNRKIAQIEQVKYILPTIHWSIPLETKIEQDKLAAFETLKKSLDIPVSKSTVYAAVGLDHEDELRQIIDEKRIEKEIMAEEGIREEDLDTSDEGAGGSMPSGDMGGSEVLEDSETEETPEEGDVGGEPPTEE